MKAGRQAGRQAGPQGQRERQAESGGGGGCHTMQTGGKACVQRPHHAPGTVSSFLNLPATRAMPYSVSMCVQTLAGSEATYEMVKTVWWSLVLIVTDWEVRVCEMSTGVKLW